MSETKSENAEMLSASEASELVRSIAEPREVGDSVKAAIGRAARRLGFGFSRTKDIWYQDAKRIDSCEMDRLREHAARIEADLGRARILALRNSLTQTDPEFHRETIVALERALVAMGCDVGSVVVPDEG